MNDTEKFTNLLIDKGNMSKTAITKAVKEQMSKLKGLINEETALFIILKEKGIEVPKNDDSVEDLEELDYEDIPELTTSKKEVISKEEMDSFFKELDSQKESSEIVNFSEFFKIPRIICNIKNIRTEKLISKNQLNFYVFDCYTKSDNTVQHDVVMCYFPKSLVTRISNLMKQLKIDSEQLKLLVKFNGIQKSEQSGKDFFKIFSKVL